MNRFAVPRPSSSRAALPLTEALSRNQAFARLAAGIEQLGALSTQLRRALPDYLRAEVEPAALRDGVLVLLTRHNALAARLRHLEPSLLAHLRQLGWRIDSLRIRVQPLAHPARTARPKHARLSAVGLACLDDLCERSEASPLKDALERMVARHRKPAGEK